MFKLSNKVFYQRHKNDNSHYLKNNNIDLICKKMYKDYKDLIEFK